MTKKELATLLEKMADAEEGLAKTFGFDAEYSTRMAATAAAYSNVAMMLRNDQLAARIAEIWKDL